MPSTVDYFDANRGPTTSRFLPDTYSRVLEVGCASGRLAETLRRRPCELWGIEPNEEAAHAAGRVFDKVLPGTYAQNADKLPAHYFDLVVCNDVIEHMPDHDMFLRDIRSKMTPGAHLVGSVPNVRHITCLFKLLLLRDWPYSDSGILDRTHLRFFTRKSLRRAFEQAHYDVEMLRGVGSVIRTGVLPHPRRSPRNILFRGLALGVVVLSLGYWADTQYPQYGFRVRPRA